MVLEWLFALSNSNDPILSHLQEQVQSHEVLLQSTTAAIDNLRVLITPAGNTAPSQTSGWISIVNYVLLIGGFLWSQVQRFLWRSVGSYAAGSLRDHAKVYFAVPSRLLLNHFQFVSRGILEARFRWTRYKCGVGPLGFYLMVLLETCMDAVQVQTLKSLFCLLSRKLGFGDEHWLFFVPPFIFLRYFVFRWIGELLAWATAEEPLREWLSFYQNEGRRVASKSIISPFDLPRASGCEACAFNLQRAKVAAPSPIAAWNACQCRYVAGLKDRRLAAEYAAEYAGNPWKTTRI